MMKTVNSKLLSEKLLIGRCEWCQLPQLAIPAIKAKIDTGAKTSALHALNIKTVNKKGVKYVHFDINPLQGKKSILIHCKAVVVDQRYIMSSNGQKEHRYVISTPLHIGDYSWEIQLTLSNRDPLRYKMLLGREALSQRTLIHPGIAYNHGKMRKETIKKIYSAK